MIRLARISVAIKRLARLAAALSCLGFGTQPAAARDAGAPENFNPRMKDRYSFEYYRRRGVFGRPGERLNPRDPRGHMSHGHGGLL